MHISLVFLLYKIIWIDSSFTYCITKEYSTPNLTQTSIKTPSTSDITVYFKSIYFPLLRLLSLKDCLTEVVTVNSRIEGTVKDSRDVALEFGQNEISKAE